jgi:hypothetical protein
MKLLTEIANKYGTDKGTTFYPSHGFSEIYDDFFINKRNDVLKVLEIGIDKGNSLRMWRDYFPNAIIYGLDVQTHQFFTEERIITSYANQSDIHDLNNFIDEYGGDFDIIIDDGGHDIIFQQFTLGVLFKYLKPNGVYIVEDLHTSFLEDWLKDKDLEVTYEYTAYNTLKNFEINKELITPHIELENVEYINRNTKSINIYDINGDNQHITSILYKK